MKRKIPIAAALRKIRAHKPSSPAAFRKIGLPVRWLKSGVFRETCRIINCDLVVKFPLGDPDGDGRSSRKYARGRQHTRTEIARIKRLLKFKFMEPYIPKVHYHDPKSGTLVMSYHPPFSDREEQIDSMGRFIQMLIERGTGVRCSDLHSDNVHKKSRNHKRVVIIDLGY
jgi:hypothetical protein